MKRKEQMSKKERVEATFKHQETDRVPLYDLMLSDACIEFFTGKRAEPGDRGRTQAEAVNAMLDMARGVGISPMMSSEAYTNEGFTLIENAGFVRRVSRYIDYGYEKKPFNDYDGARIWANNALRRKKNWKKTTDLKKLAMEHKKRFKELYSWMGENHTVCCIRQSGVGLDCFRALLGLEYFSYLTVDEPDLISEYLEISTEEELAIIHAIADPEISPFALTYGDIACKGTLLHSPEWLRKEFFFRLKKINAAYHEHELKCLYHSDGYLMEIMSDLIEAGIDGINPIETVAGMDVGEVYRLYKDKIFLTGGIDMSQLLSNGTPEQVKETCCKAIAEAPTGYFMGSTTEIDNSSKLKNVLAMIEVAWGYPPEAARE